MADANSNGETMNDSGNDDFGDEADDGLSMVSTGFYPTQEETLGPLQRLQKYWDSDNVFNRQMVARNLLDTLRTIVTSQEELEEGLKVLVRLSEDIEPMVRSELMEQIPHLAMFCAENREFFPNTIQEIILPTVVRYLTDGNNQVRKTSQAALLVLLEQELINHSDMVSQVCPVIIQLSSQDSSDDYRTEAVALMSKVSPLAGREITEGFFLPHFTVLCKDSHFHLRKVCAANIGDICNVVGQESTQAELLPRFEALCQDGVWGVRKACAECFMTVSYAVSSKVRKERLSPLFVQLLCDQSRWVRMAAFQNLGPFISTFADPTISGVQLVYNPDGTVHIRMVDMEEGIIHMPGSDPTEPNGPQNSLSKTDTFEIQQETSTASHHGNPTELSTTGSSVHRHHASTEAAKGGSAPPFASQQQTQPTTEGGTGASSAMCAHHLYSGVNEVSFTPSGHTAPPPKVECTPPPEGETTPLMLGGAPDVGEMPARGSSPEAEEFNSFQFWRNPVPVVSNKEESVTPDNDVTPVPGKSPEGSDGPVSEDTSSEKSVETFPSGEVHTGDLHKRTVDQESNSQSEQSKTSSSDSPVITSAAVFNLLRPKDGGLLSESQDEDVPSSSGGQGADPDKADVDDSRLAEGVKDDTSEEQSTAPSSEESSSAVVPVTEGSGIDAVAMVTEEGGTTPEVLPLTLEDIQLTDPQELPSSPDLSMTPGEHPPTVGETMDSHTQLQSAGVSMHRAEVNEAVDESETATNIGTMHVIGAHLDHKEEEVGFVNGGWTSDDRDQHPQLALHSDEEGQGKSGLTSFQNVIPEQLLEQYLSMTDPTRAQTVDTEIAKHCAYSLPGVALTLGRHNWPCLKEVYDTLASDMQWKVRRTLAFSIHEMALILGDEITSLDLVPIFNGFLKDLDEVRIGVLKHFADFVKLLKPQLRQQYLNRMNDFLTTDNQRNWRFRLELAEQLIDMCDFYSPMEVYDNILHIAIELACDRVADVRFMAYRLISRVLRIVGASSEKGLVTGVKQQLHHKFAQSQKWFERQAYVHICQKFLEEQALDAEQFATDFLPSMLDLSTDPIPNVRITLARTLAQSVMPLVYFTTDDNPLHERLITVLSALAKDDDMDVGYYSRLAPIGETTIPDEEPPV